MKWTNRGHPHVSGGQAKDCLSAVLPPIAALAVAVIDLMLPSGPTAMALFVPVPALALLGPRSLRGSLWAGASAFIVAIPVALTHRESWPVLGTPVLAGIAVVTILTVLSARSYERRERSVADMRDAMEAMRRTLVRPVPPSVGTVRTEVRYLAAESAAGVGGDLYDVMSTPFGVRLIIGDVKGKGLAVVETVADVLGAFRELAQHEAKLPAIAMRLDAMLACKGREEEFVTALLVTIPGREATAELVCCGHPPPLLVRDQQATFAGVLDPAPPLALLGLSDGQCTAGVIPFGGTDWLLFYTDGVTEARDSTGQFYPLRERVAALRCGPADFLGTLECDLRRHASGRLQDDAVLLLIRSACERVPSAGSPRS